MTRFIWINTIAFILLACEPRATNSSITDISEKDTIAMEHEFQKPLESGYADVNGIKMYYEIYGEGKPLVLIHGGGSTIQTTFGRLIPILAQKRRLIGVELQAHGRTSDRNSPISFEQDADDVAALLRNLSINKADIFGFSNGGNTTMRLATRHGERVDRIIVASAFYKRDGMFPGFWDFMKKGTINDMPKELKEAFLKVTPDSAKLQNLFEQCSQRMLNFQDWKDYDLRAIKARTLIVAGDKDVATPEHYVAMYRLIPDCKLMILPGGHGEFMGEISFPLTVGKVESFASLVESFLDEP